MALLGTKPMCVARRVVIVWKKYYHSSSSIIFSSVIPSVPVLAVYHLSVCLFAIGIDVAVVLLTTTKRQRSSFCALNFSFTGDHSIVLCRGGQVGLKLPGGHIQVREGCRTCLENFKSGHWIDFDLTCNMSKRQTDRQSVKETDRMTKYQGS